MISDYKRIKQILVTLLDKLIEFSDYGFIEFVVKKLSGSVKFIVKTNGSGIHSELMKTLIETNSQNRDIVSLNMVQKLQNIKNKQHRFEMEREFLVEEEKEEYSSGTESIKNWGKETSENFEGLSLKISQLICKELNSKIEIKSISRKESKFSFIINDGFPVPALIFTRSETEEEEKAEEEKAEEESFSEEADEEDINMDDYVFENPRKPKKELSKFSSKYKKKQRSRSVLSPNINSTTICQTQHLQKSPIISSSKISSRRQLKEAKSQITKLRLISGVQFLKRKPSIILLRTPSHSGSIKLQTQESQKESTLRDIISSISRSNRNIPSSRSARKPSSKGSLTHSSVLTPTHRVEPCVPIPFLGGVVGPRAVRSKISQDCDNLEVAAEFMGFKSGINTVVVRNVEIMFHKQKELFRRNSHGGCRRKSGVSSGSEKRRKLRNLSFNAEEWAKEVLIVDDNMINRNVLKNLLKKEGFSSSEAKNGLECIKLLRFFIRGGGIGNLNLILLDLQMPIMNGIQCAEEIRNMINKGELCFIPIVGISADSSEEDRKNFLGAGIQQFVEKPITLAKLRQILVKFIPNY
jgi:CheY-like chemotaxis protein